MALSGSLGFTNTTASSVDLTPVNIDITKYALTIDDPDKCVLKNITSPIDQVETLMYKTQELKQINQDEKNANPPKVSGGRLITVTLEDKMRVTSSVDDTFIQDFPISCNVSFRFAKTQYISASDLLTMLKRVVGALQTATMTGGSETTYILDQLMKGQLNPKN